MSPAQEGPNKNIVITEMRCSLLGGVVVYWEGQNYEYVLYCTEGAHLELFNEVPTADPGQQN